VSYTLHCVIDEVNLLTLLDKPLWFNSRFICFGFVVTYRVSYCFLYHLAQLVPLQCLKSKRKTMHSRGFYVARRLQAFVYFCVVISGKVLESFLALRHRCYLNSVMCISVALCKLQAQKSMPSGLASSFQVDGARGSLSALDQHFIQGLLYYKYSGARW